MTTRDALNLMLTLPLDMQIFFSDGDKEIAVGTVRDNIVKVKQVPVLWRSIAVAEVHYCCNRLVFRKDNAIIYKKVKYDCSRIIKQVEENASIGCHHSG